MARTRASVEGDHLDHVDGCLCDIDLTDKEIVSDHDLPPSKGGVAKMTRRSNLRARKKDGSDDVDGCDLDFTVGAPTGDEDLPGAVGGVG